MGGWLYTQRLKSHKTCLLDDKWWQTLRRLCGQLRVKRPVRLLESALVKVPMVIGWLRPVILLPAGALTGLTTRQLEAIIAHELAHIRRHDYLVNLLQALIETLLFYHPAVWWVSRQIRREREHCCDDLAVAVCGDAFTYARALLEMERLRAGGPQLALAANGGSLMNRIQRLVGAQPQHTNRFAGLFAGIIALTTVVSLGVGAQISISHKSHTNEDRRIGTEVFDARRAETTRYESVAPSTPSSNKAPAPQTAPMLEPQENIPADVAERIGELSSPIPEERAAAACALGTMTTRAAPAIPYLIALLSDGSPIDPRRSCKNEPPFEDEEWRPRYEQVREPSPGEAATHALMAIGKPALEPLMTALLRGEHWRTRKNAAWALAHRGRAVEQLIAALKDEAWQVRTQAAYALFQRGGSSPQVVSALIETALEDSAWQARAQAAMALGQKGDSRVDVVMPLIAALKDGQVQVRLEAARGLWECADSRAFVPMIAALKDEDPEVRALVAKALGNRADNPEVELLIAALNDNDENVRTGAGRALNVVKQRLKGRITNLRPVTIPD
jgi:HEAT repeat protein